MKPRLSFPWKTMLALGCLPGLVGCQDDLITRTATSTLEAISPQPILAQIGEAYPAQSDGDSSVQPANTGEAPKLTADVPGELLPLPPTLSPGVDEVVQLARAQVGDEVLLAYIDSSPARFGLKAADILHLHDLGLSAPVIAAMIRHDQSLPEPEPFAVGEREIEPAMDDTGPEPPPTAVAVSTESQPVSADQPAQVTNNYFYNTLAPYGTWMELPDYGWCWRPTVAVVETGWRPYLHGGRWVYSDCGWYWHSYYSWGWAPFHYGRWHLSSLHGWVWVPDTCWGPAWVTWRHYNGYYGWAPLPPGCVYTSGIGLTYYGSRVSFSFGFGLSSACYNFVPVGHFYSHRPWHHRVAHSASWPIYKNSTVINNYVNGNGNNTIINVGPGTSTLTAVTRSEIQKVKVKDIAAGETRLVRAESLSRDGRTLNVFRPQLPEQSATPPAQITRRQQELQSRSRQLASSEAVQSAVVRARDLGGPVSQNATRDPRDVAKSSTVPQGARGSTTVPRAEPQRPAASSLPSVGGAISRSEQRRPAGGVVVPQASVNRTVPSRPPATTPPTWSTPAPSSVPTRSEPARTVNPSYSVSPRSSVSSTPRPSQVAPPVIWHTPATPRTQPASQPRIGPVGPMTPSPSAPTTVTPRPAPSSQWVTPRFEPRSVTPAPPRPSTGYAPSRTYSAPRPTPAPSFSIPSRPSGSITPAPSAAPARPPSAPSPAPSPAPRPAGSRGRGR